MAVGQTTKHRMDTPMGSSSIDGDVGAHGGIAIMATTTTDRPGIRYLWIAAIVLALVAMLAGALSIPFMFESPSMWYKFGTAKISLRAGKMIGLAAGLLILLQLPLAGRLNVLDRIFSLPGLIRQHRWHGWLIVGLALAHPLCVLLPEGRLTVPLDMRYWPEWTGVILLVLLLGQWAAAQWRQPLGIAVHRWLPGHRVVGAITAILLIVHVLYVSETFTDNWPPRLAVLIAAGAYALLWLWVRSAWLRARRKPHRITRVEPIGRDCVCVEMEPRGGAFGDYLPGQFAFVSFVGQSISREPHPFTLASSPSRTGTIQVAIRTCGDWTRQVETLTPGDRAYLLGPFGRFSHLFVDAGRELVFIAGGIGITPMLSMLRHMADHGDTRPVTLIWSNRTPAHLVFAEELERLAAKLTGLRHIPIFTQSTAAGEAAGRLNRTALKNLLSETSRSSAVFLCGPPSMMRTLNTALKRIGFPQRSIFTEPFSW